MARTKTETVYKTLSDFPDHKAATDRLTELNGERNEAERRVAELKNIIGNDHNPAATEAAALVDGDTGGTVTAVATRAELGEAIARLEVLGKAIAMQRRVVSDRSIEAQQAMREERLPGHSTHVQAIAAALDQLQLAIESETEFSNSLRHDGQYIRPPLPAINLWFNFADGPTRPSGQIRVWRKRFEKCGYLKARD